MTAAIVRRHHRTGLCVLGFVGQHVDVAGVTWARKRCPASRPEDKGEDDDDDQCNRTTVRLGGPLSSQRRAEWWGIRINGLHDDRLRWRSRDVHSRLIGLDLRGLSSHSWLHGWYLIGLRLDHRLLELVRVVIGWHDGWRGWRDCLCWGVCDEVFPSGLPFLPLDTPYSSVRLLSSQSLPK